MKFLTLVIAGLLVSSFAHAYTPDSNSEMDRKASAKSGVTGKKRQ